MANMTMAASGRQDEVKRHMLALTPGKLMGLSEITDAQGRFKVLALDQSNSMRKALNALFQKTQPSKEVTYEDVRDAKIAITKELAPYASAVLLDVNYGLAQAMYAGALPKGVGLLARLEASKDPGQPGEVEPGWGVAAIKRMGASAVKLLVYLDVEDAKSTEAQLAFARRTAEECRTHDILLLIEELSYPRPGDPEQGDKKSPAYLRRKSKNILEATKLIGPYADILKLEFPADLRAGSPSEAEGLLKALHDAAIRPWVLLSAGEKYDLFVKQVEMAMNAGASGIMAGRAIFNEYFEQASAGAQRDFLLGEGTRRMKELGSLVERSAAPWLTAAGATWQAFAAQVDPKWYLGGKGAASSGSPAASGRGDY